MRKSGARLRLRLRIFPSFPRGPLPLCCGSQWSDTAVPWGFKNNKNAQREKLKNGSTKKSGAVELEDRG